MSSAREALENATPGAQASEDVTAAGDREWAVEAERRAKGIPLDTHNWRLFGELAGRFGLPPLTAF